MYRIETDSFILGFFPEIHEQDFSYPVNVNLGVKVSSYGYSADTFMDVGVRGIAEFAAQLKRLYESLTGEARLEEPYSVHNYIEFTAELLQAKNPEQRQHQQNQQETEDIPDLFSLYQ